MEPFSHLLTANGFFSVSSTIPTTTFDEDDHDDDNEDDDDDDNLSEMTMTTKTT